MIGHPLKVRELLDEVARGLVMLPEIQRAYAWKGPQVSKLLDSLYREYPAGQILLEILSRERAGASAVSTRSEDGGRR